MRRGIAAVADLRDRSVFDPQTMCWHYQGANSNGAPRIHTYCHASGEKRVMPGPTAVWNIAFGEAPRGIPYRRCLCRDCVNPAHLNLARTLADIGKHKRLSGVEVGMNVPQRQANLVKAREARGIVPTPPDVVRAIRASAESLRVLAKRHGCAITTVSQIRRGESRKEVT